MTAQLSTNMDRPLWIAHRESTQRATGDSRDPAGLFHLHPVFHTPYDYYEVLV